MTSIYGSNLERTACFVTPGTCRGTMAIASRICSVPRSSCVVPYSFFRICRTRRKRLYPPAESPPGDDMKVENQSLSWSLRGLDLPTRPNPKRSRSRAAPGLPRPPLRIC